MMKFHNCTSSRGKYRVVNAGERDLFYRNDNGKFVEVSVSLGIDGTDEGLPPVG